jgi:hypothetical protein
MPSYAWLIIIALIILLWHFWNKYGAIYSAIQNNPTAIAAGQSIFRYAQDVQGLVGAYEAADQADGSFMSRMGAFFGALPR